LVYIKKINNIDLNVPINLVFPLEHEHITVACVCVQQLPLVMLLASFDQVPGVMGNDFSFFENSGGSNAQTTL
jgi:hypothetical protein